MTEPLTIEINGQPVTAAMDEWRRVQRTVLDRVVADDRARKQRLRDAGEVWEADLCSCGDGRGDMTEEYFGLAEGR